MPIPILAMFVFRNVNTTFWPTFRVKGPTGYHIRQRSSNVVTTSKLSTVKNTLLVIISLKRLNFIILYLLFLYIYLKFMYIIKTILFQNKEFIDIIYLFKLLLFVICLIEVFITVNLKEIFDKNCWHVCCLSKTTIYNYALYSSSNMHRCIHACYKHTRISYMTIIQKIVMCIYLL